MTTTAEAPLTKKDFVTSNDVRWCPGCGDYAILNALQRVLPELGIPKEDYVIVSGIGCSSRFPYYMNTYGFHTIHGRAPTVATGGQSRQPKALRLDHYGRRRWPLDWRKSLDAPHAAQCERQRPPL